MALPTAFEDSWIALVALAVAAFGYLLREGSKKDVLVEKQRQLIQELQEKRLEDSRMQLQREAEKSDALIASQNRLTAAVEALRKPSGG